MIIQENYTIFKHWNNIPVQLQQINNLIDVTSFLNVVMFRSPSVQYFTQHIIVRKPTTPTLQGRPVLKQTERPMKFRVHVAVQRLCNHGNIYKFSTTQGQEG